MRPQIGHVLSDLVLVLLLPNVFTAQRTVDRFPIKSLLNRCTAARTPLTLLYWTTCALFLGVKERYKTRFFFWPAPASFTSLFTSARMFEAIIPDRGPLQSSTPSAGQQCSLGSQQSGTPTKALMCVPALVAINYRGRKFS